MSNDGGGTLVPQDSEERRVKSCGLLFVEKLLFDRKRDEISNNV